MTIDDHLLKNSTVIKQEVIKTTIIKPRYACTYVETEVTARCAICNSIFFYQINKNIYADPAKPPEISYYIKDDHSTCQGIKATQIIETLMGLSEQKNCCEFCSWSRENYKNSDDFYTSEIDFNTCYKKIELAIEQNVAQLKGFNPNVSKVQICAFYSNEDVIKKIDQEIMPIWKKLKEK